MEYLQTQFHNPERITEYLRGLGRLVFMVQPNLGCLILAQHQFFGRTREEGYQVPSLPISQTGFPTAATLRADLGTLHSLAIKYQKRLNVVLTDILTGGNKDFKITHNLPDDEFKPIVSANPEYLRAFLEPDPKDGFRLTLREENGWLYVERHQRDPRVENSLHPIRNNGVEAATLLGSIAGAYFFWPVLIAYPVVSMLKLGIPKEQRTYFIGDVIRYLKYRENPDIMEQMFQGKAEFVSKFKYLSPATGEDVQHPTLISVVRKGETDNPTVVVENPNGITCVSLNNLVGDLATLVDWHFRGITKPQGYLKELREGGFDVFSQGKLYDEISDLVKWEKPKEKSLMPLQQSDRTRIIEVLENFLDISLEGLDIPDFLSVDRIGQLHPQPTLWFAKERMTDELRRIREESLRFYRGEISPLEFAAQYGTALAALPTEDQFVRQNLPSVVSIDAAMARGLPAYLNIRAFFRGSYFILFDKEQFLLRAPFIGYKLTPLQKALYDMFNKIYDLGSEKNKVFYNGSLSVATPFALGGRIAKLIKLGRQFQELKREADKISESPIVDGKELVKKVRDFKDIESFAVQEFGEHFVEMYDNANTQWKEARKVARGLLNDD